jgi:hypothetical protein
MKSYSHVDSKNIPLDLKLDEIIQKKNGFLLNWVPMMDYHKVIPLFLNFQEDGRIF